MIRVSKNFFRYVSIIDCERISDGTLRALANCRNLTVLNLADCFR